MKRLSLLLVIFFILGLVLGPTYGFKEYIGKGESRLAGQRLHWNTGNTTRIWGTDWVEQRESIFGMISPGQAVNLLLLPEKDWRIAVQHSYLLAPPSMALPILLSETALTELDLLGVELERLGIEQGDVGQVMLPQQWAEYAGGLEQTLGAPVKIVSNDAPSGNVLVVAEDKPQWAIPALTWSALTGDRIVVGGPDGLTARKNGSEEEINFYVLGDDPELARKLANLGSIHQVGGGDAIAAAVKFAGYYDKANNFGWWNGRETPEGGRTYFLLDKENWKGALAAAMLAPRGRFGPILLTDGTRLPPVVENFYWRTKPEWFVTPTEGPYNHTFILGDLAAIPFAAQSRADFAEEINTYMMQGDQGHSALDSWVLVWLAWSFASAIWTWNHITTRNTDISPQMKFAWVLAALLLGPLGIYAYYIGYRGYAHRISQAKHIRPFWVQVVIATLSTLAFGAPAMIITGFILALNGLPLVQFAGPLYILGNPMLISMILSYLAGLAVLALVFVPLMLRINEPSHFDDTVQDSFPVILISMTGVSVGMLPTMWWLMMEYLPMMPEESNLLWWGIMYAATIVGAVTGLAFNWPLVAHRRKKGDM